MTKTAADYLALAADAFEAGFASEAARKRALEALSYAFGKTRETLSSAILAARTVETEGENHADYWGVPYELHHVRPHHLDTAAKYTPDFAIVADMIAMRAAIKAAQVAPVQAKPAIEVKAEAVRKSVMEMMQARQLQYAQGLDVARLFHGGKLKVSVNAHWVRGHKGAEFVRCFFYLNGRVTALQVIMAIADTLEREAASAA